MDAIIATQTAALRQHLGLGELDGMPKSRILSISEEPLFFVELSPTSNRGSKCKLPSCNDMIKSGQYRIAMTPSMNGRAYYAAKNADFYHVACFEKIADLSKADFLDRIQPVTRSSYRVRNLKESSVIDRNYLCEGGVERLVLEWKVQRGNWIYESEGEEITSSLEPEFKDLLQNAGSSKFTASGPPEMTQNEYRLLLTTLAPFESDGPEDTEEWNLFDVFLRKNKESWYDRHDLSRMLGMWETYVKTSRSKDEDLNDTGRELKARIGEKGIRAVKRLSAIPMPDLQGAFRGLRYG